MVPAKPDSFQMLGIQYFPDSNHYSDSDSLRWLPILEKLHIHWLILNAETSRAIPENFIKKLVQVDIAPILRFRFSLVNPPHPNEIEPIFSAYGKWGVRYVSFFEQPNQYSSWNAESWVQHDLVERFVDRFLAVAKPALASQLIPIFSPLFPGGNYWDTLFLQQALTSLKRRREFDLLEKMTLSAYGWTFNHPLDWGKGGAQKWPVARPYQSMDDMQDHRGFHISDWYAAISKSTLDQVLPVILFESGLPSPADKLNSFDENQALIYQNILEQLDENSLEEQTLFKGKPSVDPSPLLAVNFSLLSCEPSHALNALVWFNPDGSSTPLGETMSNLLQSSSSPKSISQAYQSDGPIDTFLLLPSFEWGVADWHLDMVRSFLKKNRPTLGFSLKDASHARKVIVIGGRTLFPKMI